MPEERPQFTPPSKEAVGMPLTEIRRRVRNIWGAISSNQVIDKDVEGQAKKLLEYIDDLRHSPSQVAPANPVQVTELADRFVESVLPPLSEREAAVANMAIGFAIAAIGAGGQAVACVACEDNPKALNIPCAVCGRSLAADERVVEDERVRRGMEEILKKQSERDIPFAPMSAKEGR